MNIKKYFWSLSPKALKETKAILKNSDHPRYPERVFAIISRCDRPKEVFSAINQQQFIKAWPKIRRFWAKTSQSRDFLAWWETIYEQLAKGAIKAQKGQPSQISKKIGKIIKSERITKGLSQKDFALLARMNQPDVSAIESGRKNITLQTLARLCKMLEIKSLPFG